MSSGATISLGWRLRFAKSSLACCNVGLSQRSNDSPFLILRATGRVQCYALRCALLGQAQAKPKPRAPNSRSRERDPSREDVSRRIQASRRRKWEGQAESTLQSAPSSREAQLDARGSRPSNGHAAAHMPSITWLEHIGMRRRGMRAAADGPCAKAPHRSCRPLLDDRGASVADEATLPARAPCSLLAAHSASSGSSVSCASFCSACSARRTAFSRSPSAGA